MGLDKNYYNLFVKLKGKKSFALAEKALIKAISLAPKAFYYYELATLFKHNKQWWQSIENLEMAFSLESNPKVKWKLVYIESLEKMNRFSKVIEVFKTLDIEEFDEFLYVRYGYALEKEGKNSKALEMFDKAIELDNKNNSQILGIGIFYEKKGNWIDALKEYKLKAKNEPFSALLHYKLGLSLDRNYHWQKAEKEISYAIALDSSKAYFFNRLAFNYERQKKFKEASEVYQVTISKEKNPKTEHYYRLGYSLFHANQLKEACEAFLKMNNISIDKESILEGIEKKIIEQVHPILLSHIEPLVQNIGDSSSKEEREELIALLIKIRAWNILERVYQKILNHDKDCSPINYANLAFTQYKQKKYKEAGKNFIEQKIIQKVHTTSEKKFETNKAFRIIATYAEYFKRERLKEDFILYESRENIFVNSKLYTILLALLEDEKFKKYTHVLVVDNLTLLDENFRKIKNIIYVTKNSNLYLKYLASAQFLINDGQFPSYFIRQEKQNYLNIEQVLEFENYEIITKEFLINRAKVSQDFLHSTHIVNTHKNLIETYGLRNIYLGKVLGANCSIDKIIEFFFSNSIDTEQKKKKQKQSLLIYASFETNGITASLLNLLSSIDMSKYAITLIINTSTITGYENKIMNLAKDMNILIRSGRMVVTVEEQWIRNKFTAYHKLENSEMHTIFKETFLREFKRMFGLYKFDNIIDFNGYKTFWSTLFAFGNAQHKSIYLHNNMYKEYLLKYSSLGRAFYLYKEFDSLISVSKSVARSNIESLSTRFKLDKDKFYFANNVINFKEYIHLANRRVDSVLYESFLADKRTKFINVARLSPEKGQEKLIEAFVKLFEKDQDIVLYIMGEGVLEQKLLALIIKYNMTGNIILLGHQENPYPFIKNSNCMILSSYHEGQALVLLEALSLGVPCISTNIAGPRSVLENGFGILCNEDIESISEAMEDFLNKNHSFKSFNYLEYNETALSMFNDIMKLK